MAGPEATIRSFDSPLRGPGRSAPSLLHDIYLFDPRQHRTSGYHLLEDGPRATAQTQYLGQLLPPGTCTHDFRIKKRQSAPPLLDERPSPETVWQVAAVCQKCRIHLLLQIDYRAAWHAGPCPNYENPLHYLVKSTWRQDVAYRELSREDPSSSDELYVYECSSKTCSAIVTLRFSPPCLTEEVLHILLDEDLLQKRTKAAFELKKGQTEGMKEPAPIEVLIDLRAYFRNAWRHDTQTKISLGNKRFEVRFGPDGTACADVLKMLGFELLPGDAWIVPRPDLKENFPLRSPHNTRLDNIEAELDTLIATRPTAERQIITPQDVTHLEIAVQNLLRALSCQSYDKDPSSRTSNKALLQRFRPFTILGIPEDAADELVVWAYQRQMALESDSMQTAQLATALEDIQKQRQSEKLAEQVAIEWSQGRYGQQAISDAYRSLGLSPEENLSDETIIGTFEARLPDAPGQGPLMRESLGRIGEYRKSQRLVDYARNEISTYEDALQYLGGEAGTDDHFLVSLYTTKAGDSNSNQMAKKAIRLVAEHRNSEPLKAFMAAGYQGELQEKKMDIGEAFNVLQISDRTIADDDTLMLIYEMRKADDPGNQAKYRKAIETIAEETDSTILKEKLQMPITQQQPQTVISRTEPIGLDNIGNTCYLNSLLQSLFTFSAVREIALNFDQYKQSLDAQEMKAKRVGQRFVSEKEVRAAQNFVLQLGSLFQSMISSPDRAIRPAQELARLTLETGLIKQGRRSSTLQSQRRPTLGFVDSRPIIGPLPQPTNEVEMTQPAQSPEPMDTSGIQETLVNGEIASATERLEQTPPQSPATAKDDDSEITLVSQPESKNEEKSNAVATEHSLETDQSSDPTTATETHPSTPASDQQSAIIDEPVAATTELSTSGISHQKNGQQAMIVYKPPEGKPPPVPPRPLATATLEQYARQQDVSEVLGHAIWQLACAIRARGVDKTGEQIDEIHDTLYGEERYYQVRQGILSSQPGVQFLFLNVPIYNEPKDLYAAIDNEYDIEPRGELEVYKTITKLPPVLCMMLGRVGENESGQHKINCHVDLPSTMYMDRYMDAPEGSPLVTRRAQTWQQKKELYRLQVRINELEPKNKPPIDEALEAAVTAFQHVSEVSVTENLEGLNIQAQTMKQMATLAQQIKEERRIIKVRIAALEQQIKDSFTDAAFRKHEYKLHAAFFHRGTVGSGHYWVYIFDHVNEVWRKYNDDHVTQVGNLREIFGNPLNDRNNPNWSSLNPANPYFLVYVRGDSSSPEANVVETVKRDPIIPPTPPPPEPTQSQQADEGYAPSPLETEDDLRPLGTEPWERSVGAWHDEYAGQPSQMSHMPPNAQGKAVSKMSADDEGFADEWEQDDMQRAIDQSLQTNGSGGGDGQWDNSQSKEKPKDGW